MGEHLKALAKINQVPWRILETDIARSNIQKLRHISSKEFPSVQIFWFFQDPSQWMKKLNFSHIFLRSDLSKKILNPFYHDRNHFLRNKYSIGTPCSKTKEEVDVGKESANGEGRKGNEAESCKNFYLLIMEWMFIVLLMAVLEGISLCFMTNDSFPSSIQLFNCFEMRRFA